ncbi:hypothetical protein V8E36_002935 [Tilletia maclaganii]
MPALIEMGQPCPPIPPDTHRYTARRNLGPLRPLSNHGLEWEPFGGHGGSNFGPPIGDFDSFVDFGGASPSPEPEDDPVREYLDLLFKYRTTVPEEPSLRATMTSGRSSPWSGQISGAAALTAALDQNEIYLRAHHQRLSCSSAPRRLPRFCQLPAEVALEPDLVPLTHLPDILPFDGLGRCGCGAPYDPASAVAVRSCTVFHSKGAFTKKIEVQHSSTGPWTSSSLTSFYTPTPLTSQLAASPTPLSAFHTTVTDAYTEHRCDIPFVAKSTFIKVYFAFLKLQDASVNFLCSVCGPTPSKIIADGVVLSHSSKLRHELLRPPTAAAGQINARALPGKVLQILPTPRQRDALRDVSHCLAVGDSTRRSLALSSLRQLIDAQAPSLHPHRSRLLRSVQEFVDEICRAEFLRNLPELQSCISLFTTTIKTLHLDLASALRFVLRELAAEEGVWQLCRPVTVKWLRQLASETTIFPSTNFDRLATSLARQFPSLGHLARLLHVIDYGRTSTPTFSLVVAASRSLLEALADLVVLRHIWFVWLPIRRETVSVYVKFGEKAGSVGFNDTAQLGDTPGPCKKYFADYVSQRQTGGIMALWCRHLICVGFHIIPRCEGRNDVFSAVFKSQPS